MSSLRVVLNVTKASPELLAAIEGVPPRLRAERIRALATLGLIAVSGGVRVGTDATAIAKADENSNDAEIPNRALGLARALSEI